MKHGWAVCNSQPLILSYCSSLTVVFLMLLRNSSLINSSSTVYFDEANTDTKEKKKIRAINFIGHSKVRVIMQAAIITWIIPEHPGC